MQDIASSDYPMDGEDADDAWETDELPSMTTTDAARRGRPPPSERPPAADPAAATAERPRILDDCDDSVIDNGTRIESEISGISRALIGTLERRKSSRREKEKESYAFLHRGSGEKDSNFIHNDTVIKLILSRMRTSLTHAIHKELSELTASFQCRFREANDVWSRALPANQKLPDKILMTRELTNGLSTQVKLKLLVVGIFEPALTGLRFQLLDVKRKKFMIENASKEDVAIAASLSTAERLEVRRAALASVERAVRGDKCLLPQPRWLCIRQLAPAADTIYMPPCVVLHRCAVDSGCCFNDGETCGPVAGEHVAMPLYLSKAEGNLIAARMLFYNHTRCSCISRDGEGQRDAARPRTESPRLAEDTQPALSSAAAPSSAAPSSYVPLPGVTEPHTAPPELRRCTCPTLFLSQALANGGCACTCRWGESGRRRECLSLARGREHFGIRDRRCVVRGQCSPPDCEYGPYERAAGRCPPRPHRRLRSRYQKTVQT
ncbi:hypothetical protein EVAR_206_1 [Eumeta japonica]|uniref:Platelet-derived growth factor (PDGF) family profile domain-containing protein n=1 Tax=Eumeta variegata TaxID=151549 RepID=A0A4C1S957_EUMVA|nr:hypothetical protein EVAR_206_1 [Eumeta japonica]